MPDGRWESKGTTGVVEITSPPASDVMRALAQCPPDEMFMEAGTADPHLGDLAEHLSSLVTETLAKDVAKLNRASADERHLYLLTRTCPDNEYFARLSDTYEGGEFEEVDDLAMPEGLTDVWFEGRAQRDAEGDGFQLPIARFNTDRRWSRHVVHVPARIASPGSGV